MGVLPQIVMPTGGKVIENDHLVPLVDQAIGQVRTDEAGTARDEEPLRH